MKNIKEYKILIINHLNIVNKKINKNYVYNGYGGFGLK